MTDTDRVTLYYAPRSRASGTRVLLEELGAPYDLHVLNTLVGEQREPAYLAVNPLGKVPAIRHGDAPQSPYADYDTMLGAVEAQLASGPYLFGDRMTAADILWGVGLSLTMTFGIVPQKDVFVRYANRITSRPAFQRINAADAKMAAEHAAVVGGSAHA